MNWIVLKLSIFLTSMAELFFDKLDLTADISNARYVTAESIIHHWLH